MTHANPYSKPSGLLPIEVLSLYGPIGFRYLLRDRTGRWHPGWDEPEAGEPDPVRRAAVTA